MNTARRDGCVRRWQCLIALCSLLLWTGAGHAAGDSLYEAVVPVAGYDSGARDQGLSAALTEVLVRVSGNRKAPQHPALARVIQNAQRLVQRYSYENAAPQAVVDAAPATAAAGTGVTPEAPSGGAAKDAKPVVAPSLMLRASFDAQAVDRVLRAAGFTVWAAPRPQTLLWLALESADTRTLAGSDAPAPLRAALSAASARRGLPILYPLLDLEDQGRVQFSDVAGVFADHLQDASQRYQPDAVLAAYLQETAPGHWQAHWVLYQQQDKHDWQAQGDLTQIADAGIDGAADVLAQRGTHAPASPGTLQLHVSGITTLERFAEIERYLAGLEPVAQLTTVGVEANGATYALRLRGTPDEFTQALAKGALLQPEPQGSTDPVLRYRIAP